MPRGLLLAMLGVVLIAATAFAGDGVLVKSQAVPADVRDRTRFYTPPRKTKVPKVDNLAWLANPIDAFVMEKLEAKGLSPSARAEKLALLRRVSFDLTGLPPTTAELEAFLADQSSQ